MSKPPGNIITIYGRNPVQEALNNPMIQIFRVHLADSNQHSPIINDIQKLCRERQIDCRYHDRMSLSRISKNRKQDQGVAADIVNPLAQQFSNYLNTQPAKDQFLIAIDGVTNPQNLGMIIRSVTAGNVSGLIIPKKGCAKLDSLVVKASAGTIFRCPLLFCDSLLTDLQSAHQHGYTVYGMALRNNNTQALESAKFEGPHIIVLGNESVGISKEIINVCDKTLYIPMKNNVESLNVSVVAGILAFKHLFN